MSRQKFVVTAQVTPDFLRDAFHEKVDIWLLMLPWDALKETATIDRIAIPTTADRHTYEQGISVQIFGSAERIDIGEEEPEPMACPRCEAIQPDLDGFGVLSCPSCGYCMHATRTGDICSFCGKRVTTCQRCQGTGTVTGMEVGFGGIDHGAECDDCGGEGVIVEEICQ